MMPKRMLTGKEMERLLGHLLAFFALRREMLAILSGGGQAPSCAAFGPS